MTRKARRRSTIIRGGSLPSINTNRMKASRKSGKIQFGAQDEAENETLAEEDPPLVHVLKTRSATINSERSSTPAVVDYKAKRKRTFFGFGK